MSLDSQKRPHQELQGKTEETLPSQADGGFGLPECDVASQGK